MIRRLVSFVAIFAVLPLGCGGEQAEPLAKKDDGTAAPTKAVAPERNPKIPVEVSYPVVSEEEYYNPFDKRRSLEVALNMRVAEEILREIALELKSQEKRQYLKTLIWYRLPATVPGVKPELWATTHFNPTLKVKIMGMDEETVNRLKSMPIAQGDELIGTWIIERPLGSRRVTIYREADVFKMEDCYPEGGRLEKELTEIPSASGRRFKARDGGEQAETHEVDSLGFLRNYNYENSLISAAPPMR